MNDSVDVQIEDIYTTCRTEPVVVTQTHELVVQDMQTVQKAQTKQGG